MFPLLWDVWIHQIMAMLGQFLILNQERFGNGIKEQTNE